MTVYRTDDLARWGTGKGSPLTKTEGDLNIWDIIQRVITLETLAGGGYIDYFSTDDANALLYVHMTNHRVLGPYKMPVAKLRGRGEWTPSTDYIIGDTVSNDGSLYYVAVDHTSDTVFDQSATDGMGHDLYNLWLTDPGDVIPPAGDSGQVLTKHSSADFDTIWSDVPKELPVGGTVGEFLGKHSSADGDVIWSFPVPAGGTTGQVLKKHSDADFDVFWADP